MPPRPPDCDDPRVIGALQGFSTISAVVVVGWLLAHFGVLGLEARQILADVAFFVASPALLLVVLLLGAVIGLKAWRRHRRRSADSASARFVGAWRELVDHARDLGQVVPLGPTVTRREQSAGIASGQAGPLARRADSFVFGPSVPAEAAAANLAENSPKLACALRRSISEHTATSQNVVEPPLPSTTS